MQDKFFIEIGDSGDAAFLQSKSIPLLTFYWMVLDWLNAGFVYGAGTWTSGTSWALTATHLGRD